MSKWLIMIFILFLIALIDGLRTLPPHLLLTAIGLSVVLGIIGAILAKKGGFMDDC